MIIGQFQDQIHYIYFKISFFFLWIILIVAAFMYLLVFLFLHFSTVQCCIKMHANDHKYQNLLAMNKNKQNVQCGRGIEIV